MLDFHTHILPAIDDGSQDVKTSVALLKMLYKQGVRTVVATPHFCYNEVSFESFKQKSKNALNSVLKEIESTGLKERPKIALGAEVEFFYGLNVYQNIEELCIEGTRYLLVEMPFSRWDNRMYETLNGLKKNRDITPVIAHIERYLQFNSKKEMLNNIVEIGAYVQSNTSFFISYTTRMVAFNMLKNGFVQFVGTDCHNLEKRKPDYDAFLNLLTKKNDGMFVDDINFWERKFINSGVELY